jgi:hypothetical protein
MLRRKKMASLKRLVPVLLTIVMVASLMIAFTMPVQAYYPGAVIKSQWATKIPTIDGIFSPGEWSDAAVVDLLAADPANQLEAYAYFKNDATYLYICVDVPDDTTANFSDACGVSFDTGHDGVYTAGHDDTFFMENDTTYHLVSNGTADYIIHCSPFDTALPLHSGLAGDRGLGSSPNSAVAHRIYEYRIPLALLLASPGDTLGFGMDGTWWMGIFDASTNLGDQWPFLRWEPIYINEYGDLILATGTTLPANSIYLHAEDGLIDLGNPVDTQWHELWPFFCHEYHLSSWNDTSGNGVLSHCDWIDMYEKPHGAVKPYHVEDVTITLNVTPVEDYLPLYGFGRLPQGEPMYIEYEGGYDLGVLTDPIGSQWHEIYPDFCREYQLIAWNDTGDPTGELDFCDYILLATKGCYGPLTCPLDEDFSGGVPPSGWTQEEPGEWQQSFSNYAGGTSPEALLYWDDISGNYSYLDSKPVDTTGAPCLTLEFKSYIDHYYYYPYYNCRVLTRADGGDSWTDVTPWSNPIYGNVGPDTYSIDISSDIGTATQVRFEFDGYYYNINDWYVDDVSICYPEPTWWHVEEVATDIVVSPEPPPVGGEAYPVSKASLLAPWVAVGVLLAGGISWYVLKRRRAQS